MSHPALSSTHVPTITVSQDPNIATVIERFDVPIDQQANAIEQAKDHIVQHWQRNSEFVGAVLLRGRTRGGLVSYTQWKLPASGVSAAAPSAAQSLAAVLPSFTLLDSRTYTVAFTHQAASVPTPTQVSMQQTPFAHFGVFSVTHANQARLLERARENAPQSLITPGLRAINFHQSIDGLQVINLGVWTTFDHMQSLLQRPGFRDDNLYWEGIADFQPDFFDVVAVEGV